jgi:chaperonin GroEL (HSP60 family)
MVTNPYKAQMKVIFLLPSLINAVAVLSNIHAVHELTEIVRTSLGPNGHLKLVVNHLGKQALTNNSSTILKEIDVVHPAAKLLVMASQQQEAEVPPYRRQMFTIAR